ncbi:MAG: methylated-DNA--[protein]-cysteine S-methyltransferase [Thermoguttaceae bacterium]|nr:methylated-DNA--[protein]-cysteine S-methyltransferase [Thermoguttaceae bacterium]
MSVQFIQTPIGILTLQDADRRLIRVEFLFGRKSEGAKEKATLELVDNKKDVLEKFSNSELRTIAQKRYQDAWQNTDLLEQTKRELSEYFDGARKEFTLPINPQGTEFRRKDWKVLATVPYGQTRTYGELAQMAGAPKASRAVGAAMRGNPIGIVLPCHRIVGSSGKLTGYNGGLDRKVFLLDLEARHS